MRSYTETNHKDYVPRSRLYKIMAALRAHIMRHPRRYGLLGGMIGFLLILFFTAQWWNPIIFPPIKNPSYGVSFSKKRAEEMDIDWQKNYLELLDDMQIKHFRLMSYWDEHEKTRSAFDFSSLDWQISEAKKRGADISLAVGLRQPRWPECHQPQWAAQLEGHAWKQALYAYIEAVVKRYENEPAVVSWQLENEAKNSYFGLCEPTDNQRISEEFNLIKHWSKKPIWMSLSDQHGYPINPPVPDKFGYSVYRKVWHTNTGPLRFYITYPTPIWYHRLRSSIITLYTGKENFIHELQLEPWGPKDIVQLSSRDQSKSMSTKQIHDSIFYAREIGMRDIYTWGGEWWYWRKVKFNDPSIWDAVKHEFQTQK